MDGSSLAAIIIPIVVSISLATWLIMVLHANSHPEWGRRQARRNADSLPALAGRRRPDPGSVPRRHAA